MSEESHLERACEALRRASDAADRTIQEQVDSVDEERDGHRTQDEPGPKAERIAELTKKLEGLEDEAGDEVGEHIATARDHCHEYLRRTDDGR